MCCQIYLIVHEKRTLLNDQWVCLRVFQDGQVMMGADRVGYKPVQAAGYNVSVTAMVMFTT